MSNATLLVELRTEELPPKALQRLGEAFANGVMAGLRSRNLLGDGAIASAFSTPRRLAVKITLVLAVAADQPLIERLMPASVGLDKDGKPTAALIKKLAAKNLSHLDPSALSRESDGKADQLVYRSMARGHTLAYGLQLALDEAIHALPIPKKMSYQLADGQTTVNFVRPAHGLVALHGRDVVAVTLLGLSAGRNTKGHRFQSHGDIALATAGDYEEMLESSGRVIVSFESRRAEIDRQLRSSAAELGASLGDEANIAPLLDEVTALVEFPAVYLGRFEAEFLAVPPECLIVTMRQNQKYFPLFDTTGKLLNAFLIVSNMKVADPKNIVEGNQRVVRPRLADARFFFDTDRKTRLADRIQQLGSVVYHHKLGNQLQRTDRVRALTRSIAPEIGADARLADRAALCAKADLLTSMVGEFPALQGIMGRYYALADGEDAQVASAIEQHYKPRFAGDSLPDSVIGLSVALADKLETLAGLFGIGQQPTGDKDPFALRRHALGVIRMLIEPGLKVPLPWLVEQAFSVFPPATLVDAKQDLENFVFERLRGYLRELGYTANETESVLCMRPARFDPIPGQLAAVRAFLALPEAQSLVAANKRVANILKQAEARGEAYGDVAPAALVEPSELVLFESLRKATALADPMFDLADYAGYLRTFAALKIPVDAFFESVMVMVENGEIRQNRLALLAELRRAMNRFSDIARLAA
ncbi:MAG: glycine--tRNA ligase subunit beta [Betaproteobacteria bacterium]|nr:glycine--tRNA ligase subunit beta [Betaproteobacteria bacterium]